MNNKQRSLNDHSYASHIGRMRGRRSKIRAYLRDYWQKWGFAKGIKTGKTKHRHQQFY